VKQNAGQYGEAQPVIKKERPGKVFQIGTVRYNWPMSAHESQAFSIEHCTDSDERFTTAGLGQGKRTHAVTGHRANQLC